MAIHRPTKTARTAERSPAADAAAKDLSVGGQSKSQSQHCQTKKLFHKLPPPSTGYVDRTKYDRNCPARGADLLIWSLFNDLTASPAMEIEDPPARKRKDPGRKTKFPAASGRVPGRRARTDLNGSIGNTRCA